VATLAELEARLEALRAQRDSALTRVSYDGRSVEYRGTAEIAQTRCLPADQRSIRWCIDQAPVPVGHFQHRRSHSVPHLRHHAEPASPGERWRHRHHHLVRRDREGYDLVDARRDMATRTPRAVRGRLVACLRHLPVRVIARRADRDPRLRRHPHPRRDGHLRGAAKRDPEPTVRRLAHRQRRDVCRSG
jgi:hypothetical protein